MKSQLEKCVVCGSTDLLHGIDALDHWENSYRQQKVGKKRNPKALFFKGAQRTGLTAVVCGSCGYVHYFAEEPDQLRFEPER